MTHKAMTAHPESAESLWDLAAPPLIWALHFLLSYVTAAVVCAKLANGAFEGARIAIGLYTLLALAGLGWLAQRGWRRHRAHRAHASASSAHARDTAEGRHRFLGFALLLLAGLSALAVLYAALAAVLIESCR